VNNLFIKLHGTGLINQLMAIELAAGISSEGLYKPVVHNLLQDKNSPIHNKHVNNRIRRSLLSSVAPKITDLIDYDKNIEIVFADNDLSLGHENVFGPQYYSGTLLEKSSKELEFSCSRININTINDQDIYLTYGNLWYSSFFFNRTQTINKAIQSVKFKEQYLLLAEKIAKSLGDFNGAHIRLTDHAFWKNPISSGQIDKMLDLLDNKNLVIATDDFESDIIKNISKPNIILDKYIEDNFMDEFKLLEFFDETVFGMIVNLVMHHSKDFVASQGSTYSGYIQRHVNQNNKNYVWKIIGEDDLHTGEHYSFSNYPNNDLISWYREWPESYMEDIL